MSTTPPLSLLADLPDSVLWSGRSWAEFARMPNRATHLTVLPVFGFADWGLGRSVDLEEILGCGVLRAMLAADETRSSELTILPPLRYVLGPYPHALFGIDYETALDLVREIGTSIATAGFRRLVLFNTSPWNEELMETCACDLRTDLGLQTFVINLEALGLDLHPTRSSARAAVQAAACALTRRSPAPESARADCRLIDFRPGDIRQPPQFPWNRSLDASTTEGWTAVAGAGSRLAALLRAIHAHPPLRHDGAIPLQVAPAATPRVAAPKARPAARRTRVRKS